MAVAYIVRCGQMRFLGLYQGLEGEAHPRNQVVVVQSDRGVELGEVLCEATDYATAHLENPAQGNILRIASIDDLAAQKQLDTLKHHAFDTCRQLIEEKRLQMDLVDVESILGGERVVFYYLAEKRVDFRELVKDLARALRTRIEMRQIGVRDEAKLLADYGDCGKPVCCNTHLTRMPPVSMRMAKLQKTTLDPSKISGRCGRLKCCLRYEFETYQEYEQELPPLNARVTTGRGVGKVIAQEVLAQKVVVELADHRRVVMSPAEILSVESGKRRRRDPSPDDDPMD